MIPSCTCTLFYLLLRTKYDGSIMADNDDDKNDNSCGDDGDDD